MSDSTHISQEEAEPLVKIPDVVDGPRLQARGVEMVLGNGKMRIIEDATYDPEIHRALTSEGGFSSVKAKLRRHHIALALDMQQGLLVALVPVADADGSQKPNVYRMATAMVVNHVYHATDARRRVASENGNIEVVDGVRRFMMPSSAVYKKKNQPATKSAASALGKSAAGVASLGVNGKSPLLTKTNRLEMYARMSLGSSEFICALADAEIRGARNGTHTTQWYTRMVQPPEYFVCTADDYRQPLAKSMPDPPRSYQEIDLLTSAVLDAKPIYTGKYCVPVHPDDEEETIGQGRIFGELVAPKIEPASEPAVTELPSMPPKSVASAASATPKRKTTASDAPAAVPDGKRTSTARDSQAVVLEKLKVLETGALSKTIHSTVFGPDRAIRGKWDAEETDLKVPAAVAAGAQLSARFHQGPDRLVNILKLAREVSAKGFDGITDPQERADFESYSMVKALNSKVSMAAQTPVTLKMFGVIGLQFLAGMLDGYLLSDVNEQAAAIAEDVVTPALLEANRANEQLVATASEMEALRKQIAELTESLATQTKKLEDVTAVLDDLKKAAADQVPKRNPETAAVDDSW